MDDAKIRNAKYNKKYKEIRTGVLKPIYLREEYVIENENESDEIRALMKVRCGNMEECVINTGGRNTMSYVAFAKREWII